MFSQFSVATAAEIITTYRASLLRICVIIFFRIFLEVIIFQNVSFYIFVYFWVESMYVCHYFYFIVLGSCIPKSINYLEVCVCDCV